MSLNINNTAHLKQKCLRCLSLSETPIHFDNAEYHNCKKEILKYI